MQTYVLFNIINTKDFHKMYIVSVCIWNKNGKYIYQNSIGKLGKISNIYYLYYAKMLKL